MSSSLIRRFSSGTLAVLLLVLAFATGLIGCRDNEEETTGSTGSTSTGGSETASENTTAPVSHLPNDLNYGNDTVTILSFYREGWTSGELNAEGFNSDPVNNAVYERNQLVENQLGVKLSCILEKNDDPQVVIRMVSSSISANTHEYDILASACCDMMNASLGGIFTDLRRSQYLDLEQPWWTQGFNDAVSYKGTQYGVTGSIVLSMYRFAFVTLFNKRLFDDAKISYPYDNVRNYTWTLDYQQSLLNTLHRDNGNGTQDEQGDVYGLVTNDYISTDPYWSSCQVPILTRDEEGGYTLDDFDAAKLSGVADKLIRLMHGTQATYVYTHKESDYEQDDIRNMFAAGNAAMATLRIMAMESEVLRGMRDEYGVVPMPTYDETQKQYRTLLHDLFTVLAIPHTAVQADRVDEISAVLEAMSYQSYLLVRPAYYDVALRGKLIQDSDSAEMLDIVINNIYMDPGILYTNALSCFHDAFRHIIESKQNTVSSTYGRSMLRTTKQKLKTLQDSLNKLVDRGN